MDSNDISKLLSRRLIDLEGRDFVALAQYAGSLTGASAPVTPIQAIGIDALADALSCSASQIYAIQKAHMLDDAVVSRIGRRIVFDVDKARAAANEWQASKRNKPAEVAG